VETSSTFQSSWETADLIRRLWRGRWKLLAFFVAGVGCGVVYALVSTPMYRASVQLLPSHARSGQGMMSQLGQFSALAGLVGVSLSGGDKAEPLAILRSRGFAADFIEDSALIPVLTESRLARVLARVGLGSDRPPDIRDAVERFERSVRAVSEDRRSGLVSVSIEWTDPEIAANWANQIADRINAVTRARALTEANGNIDFLRKQIEISPAVGLQQAASRLLEAEMQRAMLAQGNPEYAFRVVDRATPPVASYKPRKALALAVGGVLGTMLGAGLLLIGLPGGRTQLPRS
jgi:uncharacterized protein involved in exopolysaccharide biosynthesis